MKKIADNSMLSNIHRAIQTNDTPVVLSSLPNLRRITWMGFGSGLFQTAATQLCLIREPCKVEEIIFYTHSYHIEKDKSSEDRRIIEEALTSDNLPSLRSVQLHKDIPFDLFPTLQSRKFLSVYQR